MRTTWFAAIAALPFAISCQTDKPIDSNGGESDADTDSDTDSDTDTDTDTDTDQPLVAAAIGLQFEFGWDQNSGIMDACYPDGSDKDSDPDCTVPYVVVTLATSAYFDKGTIDQDPEECDFVAKFLADPATFPTKNYDYSGSGEGGTTTKTTWASWEGTLSFDETYIDKKNEPECFNLDTTYFPTGNPVDVLNGMHVGIGIGPMTNNFESLFSAKTTEGNAGLWFSGFVAVNHPDGSGGVDFTGYDWNYSYLFEVDDKGVAVVDGKNLVPVDVSVPVNLRGIVRSFPYWYEDFPHLDFSILKDTK